MKSNITIDLTKFCEHFVDAIIITKPDFDGPNNPEILYVNPALCKMSGYSESELIGQTAKIFQGPKSNKSLLAELKSNLKNGKTFEGFTVNYKKDGTEYFVDWNISPIFDDDGEIKYYFALQRDMTDSIKHYEYMEHKIKTIQDEKQVQDELLLDYKKHAVMGEMIDAIAHQWMQPLSIIKSNTESINDQIDIEKYQTRTIHNIEHLIETLNTFRDFFRPETTETVFNIETIINDAMNLMSDTLVSKKINVELDIQDNFELVGFPNEFKHIFITLINNSIDAFILRDINERTVKIGTIHTNNEKTIFVCDNAGGISPDVIGRVFDKHFTTKQSSGGTGIGLALSKQIVEKIGGIIDVQNTTTGVCFGIEFKDNK